MPGRIAGRCRLRRRERGGCRAQSHTVGVYNLAPDAGQIAKLGVPVSAFNVEGEVSLDPATYGVRTTFENVDETPATI